MAHVPELQALAARRTNNAAKIWRMSHRALYSGDGYGKTSLGINLPDTPNMLLLSTVMSERKTLFANNLPRAALIRLTAHIAHETF